MQSMLIRVYFTVRMKSVSRECQAITKSRSLIPFTCHGDQVMPLEETQGVRSVTWDEQVPTANDTTSWLTRQVIAAIWILIALAVGTIVFELGAIG